MKIVPTFIIFCLVLLPLCAPVFAFVAELAPDSSFAARHWWEILISFTLLSLSFAFLEAGQIGAAVLFFFIALGYVIYSYYKT